MDNKPTILLVAGSNREALGWLSSYHPLDKKDVRIVSHVQQLYGLSCNDRYQVVWYGTYGLRKDLTAITERLRILGISSSIRLDHPDWTVPPKGWAITMLITASPPGCGFYLPRDIRTTCRVWNSKVDWGYEVL